MIRPQNVKDSLPQTLAQKIIARAAGKAEVAVGEIEIGSVDLAMIHDSGGPRRVAPILERLGVEVWDPEKLVVVTDHYVPVFDAESRAILDLARDWVKKQGVARFHDEEDLPCGPAGKRIFETGDVCSRGRQSFSHRWSLRLLHVRYWRHGNGGGARYWRDMDPGSRNDPD